MNEKELIRFILDNAVLHSGKAQVGSVISKILSVHPELKENAKELSEEVKGLVNDINSWDLERQKNKLKELGEFEVIEKEEKDKVPELKNTNKLVVRFAPNPNGPISLGHCRPALWNWFISKKYGGKYILRFDDTDPKVKPPMKDAYKWFIEDLRWLGVKPNKVVTQSKRLKRYYKYAQKLINMNKAYVCTCETEKKRDLLRKGLKCECYDKYQSDRWKDMFDKYKPGEAVLRIKTDLKNPNPAVRDWVAFRIIDGHKHPVNTKARVWPLLNFASAIDDHEFKVTHILRGIDLRVSGDRQKYIYDYFEWKYPETIYNGKILVAGVKSTSEARNLIDLGEVSGWDDPRLGTIRAFRRRGFEAGAIIKFITGAGIGKSDVNVSIDALASFNREIIDDKTKRYFFIEDPKRIKIERTPDEKVKIPLHPDHPEFGYRTLETKDGYFYVQDELEKDVNYRFMHLFNFKNKEFVSKGVDPNLKTKMLHWLPGGDLVKAKVLMPDGKLAYGYCENDIKNVLIGEIVQFERNFFAKLEEKGDTYNFIYCHK